MASKNPPPTLKIAQILADLSDLNVADPSAALALVTAHRNPNPPARSVSKPPSLSKSSSYVSKTGTSGNPRCSSSGLTSPPPSSVYNTPGNLSRTMSRNDSTGSGMSGLEGQWERFRTPSPGVEVDPDLERARTLMRLYEIRGRFKQQENGGLARARANVEAVAERYGK